MYWKTDLKIIHSINYVMCNNNVILKFALVNFKV